MHGTLGASRATELLVTRCEPRHERVAEVSQTERACLRRDGLDNQRERRRVVVHADSGIDDVREVPEYRFVRRMEPEVLDEDGQDNLCGNMLDRMRTYDGLLTHFELGELEATGSDHSAGVPFTSEFNMNSHACPATTEERHSVTSSAPTLGFFS